MLTPGLNEIDFLKQARSIFYIVFIEQGDASFHRQWLELLLTAEDVSHIVSNNSRNC